MPLRFPCLVQVTLFFATLAGLHAGEASLVLSSETGAAIAFTANGDRWQWTALQTPGRPEPVAVSDLGTGIETNNGNGMLGADWALSEQSPGAVSFEQNAGGLRFRRVYSFGPADNILRIDTWVRNFGRAEVLTRAGLLDLEVDGESFHETGAAPASFPAFGESFFIGIEHVSGTCVTEGDRVHLWQAPHLATSRSWQRIATVVVGWTSANAPALLPGESQTRQAFLHYLDTIRVKPADMELHTNTWWSLPLPFSERDVLKDIESLQSGFAGRTGMFFDSFALDLGWSNPKSLWQIDPRRFPNQFTTIRDRLAETGTGLGVWLSPGSAYREGLDNGWLAAAGYEVSPWTGPDAVLPTTACFALGGRYQREFKENLLNLVQTYDIRHVKLDFMAHRCDVASHGHPVGADSSYAIDAGLADVLDSLRALKPDIVLEPLCCGYPPSPWWLMKTPYVLGPDGDDLPYGRVPSPDWTESLITARDIAYRASEENWLMPTQALETFDIIVQTPGSFENLAAMAVGRGRWFLSTYLKPELMSPDNWDFLAAMVRWARYNRQYLGNAVKIGGSPENREGYGYMFSNAGKDIYCVRNPWIEERSLTLPLGASVTSARDLRMIYPRRETLARVRPGESSPRIRLAPYETAIIETVSARGRPPVASRPRPAAALAANNPGLIASQRYQFGEPSPRLNYSWRGVLSVPEIKQAELCILVEGTNVGAAARISIDGVPAKPRTAASAGQFGSAKAKSPESWIWFIVPLQPGVQTFDVNVDINAESAAVGVYLRGTTSTQPQFAADPDAPFPEFHPDSRPWSQTLAPLHPLSREGL